MILKFYGACREVTGSCILVETGGAKILLECGFFQGHSLADEKNRQEFLFDPKTIDVLIVGHAHLDHVGRIPKLVREGFSGKIFSTAPTRELAQLVLEDTYKLMAEEARRKKNDVIYEKGDVIRAMELFESIDYEETIEITGGVKLTLRNSGHILGSAITQLEAEGKKLVYTSDLGNVPSALLNPPVNVQDADFVICESTYGSRVHEDYSTRQAKLNEILGHTITHNGVLLIPSFAIERTQELLHDIEHFCTTDKCLLPSFFLDSPLAEKVTEVFKKYPEYMKKSLFVHHEDGDLFGMDRLKVTSSPDESRSIDDAVHPKIIIAGSGMMNGGRILFHLQKYIEDVNNAILIIGFQAKGTLGRRLLDGEREVKIFGKNFQVKAMVLAIGSYSAHADSPQLIQWISQINNLKKVFLVHGEESESKGLATSLRVKIGAEVNIPGLGQEFNL